MQELSDSDLEGVTAGKAALAGVSLGVGAVNLAVNAARLREARRRRDENTRVAPATGP